jgi:hypothetical protein
MNLWHPGETIVGHAARPESFYTSPPDSSQLTSTNESNQHTPVTIGHHLFFSRARPLTPPVRDGAVLRMVRSMHLRLLLAVCLLLAVLAYATSPVYAWRSISSVSESFYDARGSRVGWEYADGCAGEYHGWGQASSNKYSYDQKQCP